MKNIVYVAELDADIDDFMAIIYLNQLNVLRCVVIDPIPTTKEGKDRQNQLKNMDIEVSAKFPSGTEYVFVGGRLTNLSSYLLNHKIKVLVMNGGFVGSNIVEKPLKKFEGKEYVRTFNFNMDVNATDKVLKSKNIEEIMLVGKNVCHNKKNTRLGIWKNSTILSDFNVSDTKLQHDMLACHEGLVKYGFLNDKHYCIFQDLKPCNTGLNGTYTLWGSTFGDSEYRTVKAAVQWNIK